MKLYLQSFLSTFLIGFFGAVPLVCIFIFHTLPETKSLSFKYKKENTSIAVQSVFEVLTHFYKKEVDGSLSKEKAQSEALNLIKKLRYSGQEYFWINDIQPKMIMHPFKSELEGKDLSDMVDTSGKKLFVEMVKVAQDTDHQGFVNYDWAKPNFDKPVPKISFVKLFEPWGWIIGSGVYVDNVLEEVALIQSTNIKYFAFGLFFLILVSSYTGYRQIKKWIIPTQIVVGKLTDETEKLYNSASQISGASKTLSEQSSRQASAIQETVASMEEMSAMLSKTSSQSEINLNATVEGEGKSFKTQQNFTELNNAIDQIEQSNNNLDSIVRLMNAISDKTKIINDIVFETRLLSFNASIEAARAGVHGKGFSVVSEEIGKLAHVSGAAADEIRKLLDTSNREVLAVVKDIQEKVKTGKNISLTCSEDVVEIVALLQQINASSNEITKATKEQEVGIKQTNRAMNELEQVTHVNSQNSDTLANESNELVSRTESIQDAIKNLSKIVNVDNSSITKSS